MKTQIFATHGDTREEITDLYWFEENCIHWFDDDGYYSGLDFEIFVDGVMVYHSPDASE